MEERIKKLNGDIEKNREYNTEVNNKLTNILNKIENIMNDDDKKILRTMILQEINTNTCGFNTTKCNILRKISKLRRENLTRE